MKLNKITKIKIKILIRDKMEDVENHLEISQMKSFKHELSYL